MQLQCENLNLELISEEVGAYSNTKRHSIVWYLRNAAKITDNVLEIGNNPFSTIDEDISNPILSFDSTETKLARIISICNSFKAEFQFKTNLKDDGTLQNITLDLYQTGGVGQLRKDVTLYYGKNIDGITSTGDRTSTFFNSTTVTDSNNKYNWISIEGKYYNSDGQLEFYKDAGNNTAYAPLSRDMFPSQILSTSSDQYTNKNIQTSASSNDDLWDYAVSQFKLYAYPQMTYEVVVSVNAVTSALGNDKKLNIGDTIIVQDSTFDKSEGGLILSARVSEQEISFTNPLNNKITFTNFVKLKSEISADLYGRMKDLVDQNTPYRAELETTNGVQFKNSAGSTTLTARIYFGSDSKETKADSYSWTKDGTVVANAQTITVDASGVADKAVYSFKATVAGKVVASQSVTITNVDDGTNGRSVTNVSQKWRLTTTTAAPTQAWSDAGWLTTQPTTTVANKYLWSITRTTFNLAPLTQDVIEQKAVYGDKGDKGDTGNDGRAGKDGVGINSTTITYAISSSGTVTPTAGWNSQVPTLVKGQYLWTKTVWNYSDGTSESGYTVSYIAKDGNNGNDGIAGKDGVGITATTITYAQSTSGTTAPSSGWTTSVPTVPAGQFLWTKTVWSYSDKTSETGYSVAMMGAKGDKGDKGDQGVQGLQGADGNQGVPGPKGADGKTQYTHIAYANSADGVTNFSTSDSNRAYIGMYVDFNINDSNTPSDYSWTLVKGADGTQGTPGKAGADGKTPYFHTAWSNSADGTLDFNPDYKSAVGLDILNVINWAKNTPMSNSNYKFSSNTDSSFKVTGKGTGGYEVLSKSFPAKIGDKLRFTVRYTNRQEFGIFNNYGLQFVVNDAYTESTTLSSKVVLTNKITESTEYQLEYTATNSNVWMQLNLGGVADSSQVDFDIKIEVENLTNPVKYAYIGTYSDYTATDSTVPTDYIWSRILGEDGANGTDGIAGKDGKGIKATAITYQASTNGTTAPTGTWSASVPPVAKGSFLWTRTIWTYTDNTTETGYAVAYMGTNGNNGNDGIAGKDGVGIKTTTITYAGSTSGTTVPTSGWTSTVPTVAAGSYLWTKTVWAYTDNTSETGYSVGKMGNTGPAGPAGSNGNPGKVVSDTEPTTKFKGLTWKYSGVVDMTLGDGTKILAGTEYYWNGTVWTLYEINAHNINGDNLSVTNGTFKDGKIESIWGGNGVNGTTTIEGSHLQIYSSNSTTNTENTVALDNLQGYAQVYTDHNTGRTITVQASFQGFFISDSTGPYVSVTPTGIVNSVDVSWTTIGSYAAYRRDGRVVTIRVVGAKRSTTGDIYIGSIPLKDCPAASVMGTALAWSASVANDKHIQINGLNQQNSGSVTILSAAANQEYTFQLTYQI
ncbi:collagen-like protein [Lactococcus cremoris]|uniref:collagen-like protein n=1 Tax=Lactococcus lactis subsp. cremoris TaxID=1359 RepID=UPI000AC5AB76|nr:collagen-like protein [Lactococcus cremoris]